MLLIIMEIQIVCFKTPTFGFDSGSIEFKEHTFSIDQLPTFRSYRIKICFRNNQTYVPRVKTLEFLP